METVLSGLTPYTNYIVCVMPSIYTINGTKQCLQDIVTLEGSKFCIICIYIMCYIGPMPSPFLWNVTAIHCIWI